MSKYKKNKMVVFLIITLIFLCVLLLVVDEDANNIMDTTIVATSQKVTSNTKIVEEKQKESKENIEPKLEENINEENANEENIIESDIVEEEIKEISPIVYDGLTLEELTNKLERSMKNELSGHGYIYASYSLERGVDPYLALAISLEETGCNWNCSSLIKNCNNVGGMKGNGCGAYGYFNSLDEGIKAFIDNIANNYVTYGLTTADTMNPKYAENPMWSTNVNNYISIIRNK